MENIDYLKIGSRIREIRTKRGMSQAKLAEAANISLPNISYIELGKTRMQLSTFVRICEALQVSSDSLLRADVPEVNNIYQNEFSELLSDCSPAEIDTILRVAKEMKAAFHDQKDRDS